MTPEQERSLLVLVDELVNQMHAPVLVPDLRNFVSLIAAEPGLRFQVTPSLIFHALRDLVDDGLVDHTSLGYALSDTGRGVADRVRHEEPLVAERAREVVREYAVQ
jgi:DNA-binding PadR family transcriptional regulator